MIFSFRHSRAGGNPDKQIDSEYLSTYAQAMLSTSLDFRLRGNDGLKT